LPQKLLTEEEALTALSLGSEQGLVFFFNRYYPSLALYSSSLTNNSEVSKEIVSEAFLKLWNNRQSTTEWQKIKPLLYRMVYNASVDYIREQKVKNKRVTDFQLVSATSERAVLDKLIETETYHRLYELLQRLSPRAQQIFRMFYFQKKGIKEISLELGISVNTVKTQKLRALQTLRAHQSTLYFFIAYCLIFI
jgi:RNA polymerase sigma-70 factor (family 1)